MVRSIKPSIRYINNFLSFIFFQLLISNFESKRWCVCARVCVCLRVKAREIVAKYQWLFIISLSDRSWYESLHINIKILLPCLEVHLRNVNLFFNYLLEIKLSSIFGESNSTKNTTITLVYE